MVVTYPDSILVADPDLPYAVTVSLDLTGPPAVEWMRCERWDDGPAVTQTGLRGVPIRTVIAAARHALEVRGATLLPLDRTRTALTDEHLAEVAKIYRLFSGYAPVAAVARHWNKPPNTARRWVALARARGLL